MSALRFPAYAKQLLLDRRAGRHPVQMHVVYGNDWRSVPDPKVCVKPEDYEPGTLDWRVVAGVRVVVVDQVGASAERGGDGERWGVFYDLLGELVDAGAHVAVHWTSPRDGRLMMASVEQLGKLVGDGWWTPARAARWERAWRGWLMDIDARFAARRAVDRSERVGT